MIKQFKLPDWFFFLLLIGLTIAFYRVISYFIINIVFAMLLAHSFFRFCKFLQNRLHIAPTLAALICVLITLFFIIIPLVMLGLLLSKEFANIYFMLRSNWNTIQHIFSIEHLKTLQDKYPFMSFIFDILNKFDVDQQVDKFVTSGTDWMIHLFRRTLIDLSLLILHLVVTMLLTFFLLVDGERLIERVQFLSPLHNRNEKELFQEVIRITDATLIGTIIIGMIEGTFGGILFKICGIPSPVFWGVLMMMASIVPLLGIHSFLFPAGVFMLLTGHFLNGIILVLLSHLGTTTTQHYLKPFLIGKRGGVHPAFILLSTLGGIAWLGLPGFLMGPIIAALFMSIWDQFGRSYKEELDLAHTGGENAS